MGGWVGGCGMLEFIQNCCIFLKKRANLVAVCRKPNVFLIRDESGSVSDINRPFLLFCQQPACGQLEKSPNLCGVSAFCHD
jgi:hypothetical protein